MNTLQITVRAIAVAAAITLSACGGGGYGGSSPPGTTVGMRYVATTLVTDSGAAHIPNLAPTIDLHLINPWGIAFSAQAEAWVTLNGAMTTAGYASRDFSLPSFDLGVPAGSAPSARPTGVVFNTGIGFSVMQDGRTGVGRLIVASEGGTLSAWAPSLGLDSAVLAYDGSPEGAVYTGLVKTLGAGGDEVLFATDFHNRVVTGFTAGFLRFTTAGGFIDANLPAGYAPFAIQSVGAQIYVAYAKQDAQGRAPASGAGLGLVDTFDSAGHLIKRLIPTGSPLNAPWGMTIAPANFGVFSNALLVANTGDGKINAFDASNGQFLGALIKPDGSTLVIDGLRAIAFGNGAGGQPTNTLFFTAGPDGGRHGTYGRIDNQ